MQQTHDSLRELIGVLVDEPKALSQALIQAVLLHKLDDPLIPMTAQAEIDFLSLAAHLLTLDEFELEDFYSKQDGAVVIQLNPLPIGV